MRRQTPLPILRLVGDLDELDLFSIAFSVRSRLVLWEATDDVRLGGLDVAGRGGGPYLHEDRDPKGRGRSDSLISS
jgi:hypothetical protein